MAGLGEILRNSREARGVSLEEAERVTHIARRYLTALEDEDFGAFPAPVFGRGFLRNYSQYLGLNTEDVLALWPADGAPRAVPEAPVVPDAPRRGARFGLPARGAPQQDEQPESAAEPERPRPRLPLRAIAPEHAAAAGQRTPSWERRRTERRAARSTDAPGPLTRGVAPDPVDANVSAARPFAAAAVPVIVALLIAFGVGKAEGHTTSAPKATRTTAAATGGNGVPPPTGPARSAGSMPRLVGLTGAVALQQLHATGVTPIVISMSGSSAPAAPGSVLSQDPSPGTAISTTSTVTLIVAAGGALPGAAPSAITGPRLPAASATPGAVRGVAPPVAAPPSAAPTRPASGTPRVP